MDNNSHNLSNFQLNKRSLTANNSFEVSFSSNNLSYQDAQPNREISLIKKKPYDFTSQASHQNLTLIQFTSLEFNSKIDKDGVFSLMSTYLVGAHQQHLIKNVLVNNFLYFSYLLTNKQRKRVIELISQDSPKKEKLVNFLNALSFEDREIGMVVEELIKNNQLNIIDFLRTTCSLKEVYIQLLTKPRLLMGLFAIILIPYFSQLIDEASAAQIAFLAKLVARKENDYAESFNLIEAFYTKFTLNASIFDFYSLDGIQQISKHASKFIKDDENSIFEEVFNLFEMRRLAMDEIKNRKFLYFIMKEIKFLIIRRKAEENKDLIARNMLKLEKQILQNFQKNSDLYDLLKKTGGVINKDVTYTLFKPQKKALDILTKFLQSKLSERNLDFKLIPYGSITSFTATKTSDLDCHIEFSSQTKEDDFKWFWSNAKKWISEISTGEKDNFVFTGRLVTMTYVDKITSVDVDINGNGYCGVLNSALIRHHALSCISFPILAVNLKTIMKKNFEKEVDKRPNNYSFILMLVTFLQNSKFGFLDKVMQCEFSDFHFLTLDIDVGNNRKNVRRDPFSKLKQAVVKVKEFNLPTNCVQLLEKRSKCEPKYSHALILIKFFEFFIFEFNPYTHFIDCKKEDFRKIDDIMKDYRLTYKRFFKLKNQHRGLFLIADPFDHYYNCAKELEMENCDQVELFYDKMIMIYERLLLQGSII